MSELLSEYGLFLAKTLTIVILIALLIRSSISSKSRVQAAEKLEIKHLNKYYERMTRTLMMHLMPKKEFVKKLKSEKAHKNKQKYTKRVFVLDFHGDIRATAVASLREEITAVLSVATPEDEILLRLESGGGLVHEYGLAASQLERIRKKQIPLIIAVDKIAASGGYMMACVGNRIIAAPFAIIGSIGALMQVPNFHRLLDKHGIDFEQIKAGELKRTVTLFGINTDQDRELAKKQVEDIHQLFKEFVARYRPDMDLSQTATGQHWHAIQAKKLNLIDDLETSDDYLAEACKTANLYKVTYTVKKTFAERFLARTQAASDRTLGPF
ncbi:inner membrane peptidase, Serine peptidase, MEROPS family S49 [Nitrosococcus oceani ATCC 19707]|uniref:Inner membrane peptidase, Serine peptidase, MEROPS family S49 n=2 Tax=Nitrosococcus oceani TaxID=1229 RepID=Q3JCU0_NITOC|nr:protease SohB [Nitrosococcus oceani]ABA57356.1 inner membrane peptidase, Serine peptidase, MEROPS family S49 [Nitrosococcus oceani ATCC 19707]EDZ67136.1 peptidase family S49 N-terminal domain protein [Nitrosococcus oceani AFC27]KFI20333.1 peptidase S49 [Nitrosococcus oceani C-27]